MPKHPSSFYSRGVRAARSHPPCGQAVRGCILNDRRHESFRLRLVRTFGSALRMRPVVHQLFVGFQELLRAVRVLASQCVEEGDG